MAVESKFTEVDLADGIEAVNPSHVSSTDEVEQNNNGNEILSAESTGRIETHINLEDSCAEPSRKDSQPSLQSSSARTASQSTLFGADEETVQKDNRETSPPAYQDVEAQRRESEATTTTVATSTTEVTAAKHQTREERAAGKGFFSWLTRTRPPPSYPSERTVSPEYTAGIFSRLTFQWMSPMMSVSTDPPPVRLSSPHYILHSVVLPRPIISKPCLGFVRQLSGWEDDFHAANSTCLRARASARCGCFALHELTTNRSFAIGGFSAASENK